MYVWAGLGLAAGGVVVPQGTDEALIHLELAGFATCLVLGVGSRVFGRFLLLRTLSKLETWVPRLAVGWGVGLVLVAGGWLLDGSSGCLDSVAGRGDRAGSPVHLAVVDRHVRPAKSRVRHSRT